MATRDDGREKPSFEGKKSAKGGGIDANTDLDDEAPIYTGLNPIFALLPFLLALIVYCVYLLTRMVLVS